MNGLSDEICAYRKAERGDIGSFACGVGVCAVSLFVREGEQPVPLNSNVSCGVSIYPLGTMEWSQVEVRQRTVTTSSGDTVTLVAVRNTLQPKIQE